MCVLILTISLTFVKISQRENNKISAVVVCPFGARSLWRWSSEWWWWCGAWADTPLAQSAVFGSLLILYMAIFVAFRFVLVAN